jgi:hypothetical protein
VASYLVFKVFDVVARGRERIEVSGAFVSFFLAVGGTIALRNGSSNGTQAD